ncbi:hypothetical protein PHLCEN_2v5020 [Hermanssonia centrifuga]|uniref:FAD linked oxidase N-terminal domain-containing protein n=1 Tax=Hermanssonia centrifuga TaxID=98765 RepID=A0A2R6PC93_9APHY|nr:hypothetical protein PHLCEN_2v5020 [Hermanssonia centrifuga]
MSTSSAPINGPNATARGLLAGMGFTLAIGLFAYNAGIITTPSQSPPAAGLNQVYGSPKDVQQAISELRAEFSDEKIISTDPDVLKTYGSSANSYHPAAPHSVVVHVRSTEDVVKVVNIARKYRVPIVPYSGATSLEGHFSGVAQRMFSMQSLSA